MKLDRYEISTERQRISGQLQARGVQSGFSSIGMFLFGLPFFGVGVWATLAGTQLISINPDKLHAPHWVLAAFGAVFALAGLMLWGMGWRQFRANQQRARMLASRADEPALADYPWDPRGFSPPRWSRAAKAVGAVLFLAFFLSMFNWWAFMANGPWMVKAVVLLFDLILVFAAGHAAMIVGRTLKFGPTRIEFVHFPFRPGGPVALLWQVPHGLSRAARGTFTLRCVEEWYEVRGSGKKRSRSLVQEHVWSVTAHVDQSSGILPGKIEELRFDLPADVPSTSLTGERPVFWELAVDLDLAGLDFKETYLVPVYRAG